MKLLHDEISRTNTSNFQHYCVFSHFDTNNKIERHVIHYLNEIATLGYVIIFVSTSNSLTAESIQELKSFCRVICVRENVGYDFGSYKEGIQLIQEKQIQPASILLANDSVYGPFWPLRSIWSPAILEEYDFYGLTDSFDKSYHIQSYFLAFSGRLARSKEFSDFWKTISNISPAQHDFKSIIIDNYEVGGSQHFLAKGYKIGAAFSYEAVLERRIQGLLAQLKSMKLKFQKKERINPRELHISLNASHHYWDTLLDMGFPFIKRELLAKNPSFANINDWPTKISSMSDYDITMIAEALVHQGFIQPFYPINSSEAISKINTPTDTIRCSLSDIFIPHARSLKLPLEANFLFDEAYYLQRNPDVMKVVQSGEVLSGLQHFQTNGQYEGRIHRFTLCN